MIKIDVYNQPIEVDDIPDNNNIDIVEFMNNDELKFIDIIEDIELPTCNFGNPMKLSVDTPLSFNTETLIAELMRIDDVTEVKIDDTSLAVYCNGTVCKPVDNLLRDERFQVKPYVIYFKCQGGQYAAMFVVKQEDFDYNSTQLFYSDDGENHISPHPNISNYGAICYGDEDLITMYQRNKNLPMLIVSIIDFMKWCYIGSSYFNPFVVNPCESCPYTDMRVCQLCKCYQCEFRNSYQCNNCDDKYTITNVYNSVYTTMMNTFEDVIIDIENTWRYYDIPDYNFDATAQQIMDIFNSSLNTFESNGIITIDRPNETTRVSSSVLNFKTIFRDIRRGISENTSIDAHTEFEVVEIVYKTEEMYKLQVSEIKYKMSDLR